MTDEIKEMLDYLKNNTFIPDEAKRKYKILHRDEVNKLLDYIANLQEEKQEMKNGWQEEIYEKDKVLSDWLEDERKINILQQRIDKAIEYIETHKEPLHHYFDEPDCDYWIATNPQDIIDILRGDE